MEETELKNFVKNELETIYEEFDAYINQLLILKPFIKDLIQVVNGAQPRYKLSDIFETKKDYWK